MRLRINWRHILSRAPLPMLALAASWGVFEFASLFVPMWVAIVQAAAFELTYIGLAVVDGLPEQARKRATAISVGAVVTSILYNTLAGLFHRNPAWLGNLGYYEWGLALLHGLPLAWVAYLVADLLLHSTPASEALHVLAQPVEIYARPAVAPQVAYPEPVAVHAPPVVTCIACNAPLTASRAARGYKRCDKKACKA